MHPTLALPALLAFVALAGCNGEGDDGPPAPPMEDGKYVIHLTGTMFVPKEGSIPAGSTVVWVVDTGIHDVTEGTGGAHAWSSDDEEGKLATGDRYERTFADAGTVQYRCALHTSSGMVGTLTVT